MTRSLYRSHTSTYIHLYNDDNDDNDRQKTLSPSVSNQSPPNFFSASQLTSPFGRLPTTKFPFPIFSGQQPTSPFDRRTLTNPVPTILPNQQTIGTFDRLTPTNSLPTLFSDQQTKSPFDRLAATKGFLRIGSGSTHSRPSSPADPPLTAESAIAAWNLQREQMRSAPPADWPTLDENGRPRRRARYGNLPAHGRPPRTHPNRERTRIHDAMVKLEMDLAELDRQALASGRRLITCEAIDRSKIVMEF